MADAPRKTVMSTFGLPDLPKFGEEQERWLAEQEVKKKTTVVKSDGFNLGQLFTCGACGRKPGRSSEEARAVLERRPTMRTRELEALKAELAAAQETAARAEALKADLMAAEKRALYTAMKERQSREATEAEMSKKAEQAEDRAAKAEFDKIKADLAAEAEKAARQNDTDRLNQRLAMEEKRAADQASREKAELAFEVRLAREADIEKLKDGLVKAEDRELAELKATVRRQSMALKQQKKENEELQEVAVASLSFGNGNGKAANFSPPPLRPSLVSEGRTGSSSSAIPDEASEPPPEGAIAFFKAASQSTAKLFGASL